jgi:hypothetical protein
LILLVICCASSLLHLLCICINKHKKRSSSIHLKSKLKSNSFKIRLTCPTLSDTLSELVIIFHCSQPLALLLLRSSWLPNGAWAAVRASSL